MHELYVSTDIETDGPIPGLHSMLSFGSAAYLPDKTLVSTFTANLTLLPEATQNPQTMAWWETQPVAWKAGRENLQPPEVAMKEYVTWLKSLPGRPIFVGYPVGFDSHVLNISDFSSIVRTTLKSLFSELNGF